MTMAKPVRKHPSVIKMQPFAQFRSRFIDYLVGIVVQGFQGDKKSAFILKGLEILARVFPQTRANHINMISRRFASAYRPE
jgi:hypothetical protein